MPVDDLVVNLPDFVTAFFNDTATPFWQDGNDVRERPLHLHQEIVANQLFVFIPSDLPPYED